MWDEWDSSGQFGTQSSIAMAGADGLCALAGEEHQPYRLISVDPNRMLTCVNARYALLAYLPVAVTSSEVELKFFVIDGSSSSTMDRGSASGAGYR